MVTGTNNGKKQNKEVLTHVKDG